MIPRGFPNIEPIREALGVLIPAIKRGELPAPPAETWRGDGQLDPGDALIQVQKLARRIAEAYGLDVGLVVVSFRSDIKAAGRVELGGRDQRDFFVEVKDEFASNPGVLSAILGHEVGHIFLHRHRLHPPPGLTAEIHTDTVAVLYGFGAVMAGPRPTTVAPSRSEGTSHSLVI